ncbi:MAG: succinate dehydrogenase [Sulfolobaceae archaeon]|jgi:succinate dehydrogenase/fumarate reductase subunit D|nr:succinate dehydrogenase [Sulfolobaceae archaeon]
MLEEEIQSIITKIGGKINKGWYSVSERPGRPPFAKELEYTVGDLYWGKVHLRNDGEIYVLVISKDVFNWKDRVKDLKVNGEIVDAAGGLMWLREEDEKNLESDLRYLIQYLNSVRSSSSQH